LLRRKITRLEGGRFEMELLRNIEEAAFSILSQLGAPPPRRVQQGSLRSILAQLQNMKIYVDSTVDTRLDFYIEVSYIISIFIVVSSLYLLKIVIKK